MADECRITVENAVAGKLTAKEIDSLIDELSRRRDILRARDTALSLEDAAIQAADQLGQESKLAAVIEQRNAAINTMRQMEIVDYVKSRFGAMPAEGLKAVMVGSARFRKGARLSANRMQKDLLSKHLGRFTTELNKLGLQSVFNSGSMDREISQAMELLNKEGAKPEDFKGPKQAMQIAQAMNRTQEAARLDANKAGAWVGKLDSYIVRQSHDSEKILKATFDGWRRAIEPKLDLERTFPDLKPDEIEDALRNVYKGLASGTHLKDTPEVTGFKGPGNVARRLSKERSLHFKDGDAWFDYNQQFGRGNLRESFIAGIQKATQTTGLMRAMGTNPEGMLDSVHAELARGITDPEKARKFAESMRGLKNDLSVIDGSINIPGSFMGARWSNNIRAWEGMARLGLAVFSHLSLVPNYAAEMNYQGRSFLGSMGEALGHIVQGRPSGEQKEILSQLDVFMHGMLGEMTARFSSDGSFGGKMSRLQQQFFRLNGMHFWIDSIKHSAALSTAHGVAQQAGKEWEKLGPEFQRVLSLYNFDQGKWDILRAGEQKLANGKSFVTQESLKDIPDEAFSKYLIEHGQEVTPKAITGLREQIGDQYRSFILDRMEYATIEPDARIKSMMLQGTHPGTIPGEIMRFIGQFKQFPVAFVQKALGRETYGRGADTLGQALKNGNGEVLGMAQLILWSTLFGYGTTAIKDLVKGREPRDPTKASTWGAAMQQGGGLGIFGDFMFGEKSRFGQSALDSLLGPTFGAANELEDVVNRIRDGNDPRAKALKFGLDNTPFINLFYLRPALDYLILYRIQESMNPGYLRRMEAQVQKENNQQFLIRPSQVVH